MSTAALTAARQLHPVHIAPSATAIAALLSRPAWSVRALLPTPSAAPAPAPVTPARLRKLLLQSALPPPASAAQERAMLAVLAAQLHFVRAVQAVDTAGVEPLAALRDETAAARSADTIGLDAVREVLDCEVPTGHYARPRRTRDPFAARTRLAEDWDALSTAPETTGRHIVINTTVH